jgi:hypothetical protein
MRVPAIGACHASPFASATRSASLAPVFAGSLSLPIAAVVGSSALPILGVLGSPLPIAPPGVGSPSLPVLGVLALPLPVASVLRSLLVSVLLLPTAVVVGQAIRVLLLPAAHARLALRDAAILPRAITTELRRRLVLPALRAALQVTRGRHGDTVGPHDHSSGYAYAAPSWQVVRGGVGALDER